MLLCLSHSQTLVTLDELGEGHDAEVRKWQGNIASSLTSESLGDFGTGSLDARGENVAESGAGVVGSSFQHEAEALQEPVTVPVVQELSTDAPTSSSEASLPPTSPCGSPSTESEDSPASPVPSELTFSELSSPDIDAFLGSEYHPVTPHLQTYRLVGDNIDKNVKPRNMTSDHQTRSLHYFSYLCSPGPH